MIPMKNNNLQPRMQSWHKVSLKRIQTLAVGLSPTVVTPMSLLLRPSDGTIPVCCECTKKNPVHLLLREEARRGVLGLIGSMYASLNTRAWHHYRVLIASFWVRMV